MAKRMQQIAKKGLAFELNNRKAAETAIENEEINYRYEKGWTIGRDLRGPSAGTICWVGEICNLLQDLRGNPHLGLLNTAGY